MNEFSKELWMEIRLIYIRCNNINSFKVLNNFASKGIDKGRGAALTGEYKYSGIMSTKHAIK